MKVTDRQADHSPIPGRDLVIGMREQLPVSTLPRSGRSVHIRGMRAVDSIAPLGILHALTGQNEAVRPLLRVAHQQFIHPRSEGSAASLQMSDGDVSSGATDAVSKRVAVSTGAKVPEVATSEGGSGNGDRGGEKTTQDPYPEDPLPDGQPPGESNKDLSTAREPRVIRTDSGPALLFPKDLLHDGDLLSYFVDAYNQSVADLHEEENQGFPNIGWTLENRTLEYNYERRNQKDIPPEEITAYKDEKAKIRAAFSQFASTRPIIATHGDTITYQQVYMGTYPVLSDGGEMAHRPIVVSPSINGKPGEPTAKYSLDVYIRDPKITDHPNFDTDRLVFSMTLDSFPHPITRPTYEYIRGFGSLLDQVSEKDQITIISGKTEKDES